jgi:hypothetical protein
MEDEIPLFIIVTSSSGKEFLVAVDEIKAVYVNAADQSTIFIGGMDQFCMFTIKETPTQVHEKIIKPKGHC